MKILFDINHPAHVHFFKNPAIFLHNQGHDILFTSRFKECTTDLLDDLGFPHQKLSVSNVGNLTGIVQELFCRDLKLLRYVRTRKPDLMCAVGGTFVAHVSAMTKIPSLIFYDTENAWLQNLITYPFAFRVVAPQCYRGWLPLKSIRYPGYHELSYLHPKHFTPCRSIAINNGLNPHTQNFLIRIVSWNANHDLLDCGWNIDLLQAVVDKLSKIGNVCISSEGTIPKAFEVFLYKGKLSEIHHFMAFCDLFVGESATMASECAVLGVPALYIANTGRGYITDQMKRYGLVQHIHTFSFDTVFRFIDYFLSMDVDILKEKQKQLIHDNVDVASFVSNLIVKFKSKL